MSGDLGKIFEGFEPEVSDKHVAERWMLLKKKLEDKRRPLMVLWRGRGRAAALAASLAAAIIAAYLFVSRPSPAPRHAATITEHTVTAPRSAQEKRTKNARSLPSGDRDPRQTMPARTAQRDGVEKRPGSHGKMNSAHLISLSADRENTLYVNAKTPATSTGSVTTLPDSYPDSSLPYVMADKLPRVEPRTGGAPEPALHLTVIPLQRSLNSRYTVDLVAGAAAYRYNSAGASPVLTSLKSADAKMERIKGIVPSITAGLRLRIKTRWFAAAQLSFMSAHLVGDNAGTTTEIRSMWRLGVGPGIRLHAAPMFTVSALAGAEYVRANYEDQTRYGRTFGSNLQAAPLLGNTYNSTGTYNYRYTASNWGLLCGLVLERKLGRAVSIAGRVTLQQNLRNGAGLPGGDNTGTYLQVGAGFSYKFNSR